jgi:hypothetical protein
MACVCCVRAQAVAAGFSSNLDTGCKVRAKLDSHGLVYGECKLTVNPALDVTFGMKVDARNLDKDDKHTFGVSFDLKA